MTQNFDFNKALEQLQSGKGLTWCGWCSHPFNQTTNRSSA